MAPFRASLAVVKGTPNALVDVGDEGVVVGTDPTCALVLEDEYLSRQHVRIGWHGGRLILEDAGSTNGVYVNGQRTYGTWVTLGDVIDVGRSRLKIVSSPPAVEG